MRRNIGRSGRVRRLEADARCCIRVSNGPAQGKQSIPLSKGDSLNRGISSISFLVAVIKPSLAGPSAEVHGGEKEENIELG